MPYQYRYTSPVPPKPKDGKSLVALVGAKHRGTGALVASLPAGEPLVLRREPTNAYDRNAVQVFARGQHVGYLKASQVKDIAARMDASGLTEMTATLALQSVAWPIVEINI